MAAKTRCSTGIWASLATSVASAHRYSAWLVAGRTMVTARANRSQRPRSAATPASRRAAPKRADITARSSPSGARAGSAIRIGQHAKPGRPDGLQILGVLEHGPGGAFRRVPVQAVAPQHLQGFCPADGLGHSRWLGQV